MYSRSRTEPLKSQSSVFKIIVSLSGVDTDDNKVIFPLLEATQLKEQALLHVQDTTRNTASCVDEVIDLLESYFLDLVAPRVTDEVWGGRSNQYVLEKDQP